MAMDSISRVHICIIHEYGTTYQETVFISFVVSRHSEELRMSLLKCFSVFVCSCCTLPCNEPQSSELEHGCYFSPSNL